MPAAIRARSRTVYARGGFGAFAAECTAAAARTAERTAKEGAKTSRRLAPTGEKPDRRPGHTPIKKSISWRMTGGSRAEWYCTSKHALHVEYGTGPHLIRGKMNFAWTNAGTFFYWNNPKFLHYNWDPVNGAVIRHPGAGAQPYLRPAYAMVVQGKMMKIAKEEFPGG